MTFQAAKKTKQNDAMHFTAGAVPVPVALESEYSGELPPEVFSKVNLYSSTVRNPYYS